MSRTLTGLGVSPGIAIGEPVVHETRPMATLRIPIPEPSAARADLEQGILPPGGQVRQQLGCAVHSFHRLPEGFPGIQFLKFVGIGIPHPQRSVPDVPYLCNHVFEKYAHCSELRVYDFIFHRG